MPADHAALAANTAHFVRDYPFALRQHASVQGNNAPPVAAYNLGAVNAAIALVNRGAGQMRWFTVDAAPAPYRWGAPQVPIKAGIDCPAVDPGGPPANALDRQAFVLPWATTAITSVQLDHNANFFFTAPLSGCTIFVDDNAVGGPMVYHANAGNIPDPNKDTYMQLAFQALSGRAHNAPNVRSFVSRPLLSQLVNTNLALAAARVTRKRWQLRRNVQWLTLGANVVGRRNGGGGWDFYWQVVGVLDYDRPHGDHFFRGRETHVTKLTDLEVVSTGQI